MPRHAGSGTIAMRQQLLEAIKPDADVQLQLDQLLHAAVHRVAGDPAQIEHVVPAAVLVAIQLISQEGNDLEAEVSSSISFFRELRSQIAMAS